MLRRPGVLLAIACGCALATVALWFAANDVEAGRSLDAALANDLFDALSDVERDLLKGVQSLGDTLPVAVGSFALAGLAWLRGGRALALVAALVLLTANVITQLAQPQLIGARRVEFAGTVVEGSGSWPSGHATAVMLLALGAIMIAGPRLRAVTTLAGLGFAFAVGAALVALGGHLPSDVLAAFLVAATFTAAGAAVHARLREHGPEPHRTRAAIVAPALGALAAAAVLAAGIGKAVVTRRNEVVGALDQVPLLLGATAALTVLVLLGAGAALALALRR